jgi:transposase
LSVLKVITRREGGGRSWKSRSDFQGAVGAFSASMAPVASRAPKPVSPHGSGLGVFRWVVERTLAWLHRFRRLALRYERRADVHEAFLTFGCALITWRYLKREF